MDLLSACVVAFVAVFVLLSFLAVVMHLITLAFPASAREGPDAAIIAAISSTVAAVVPGAQVTHIEEKS